jgi:hypothetical protein
MENNKTEKKGLTLFSHPENETLGLGGMFGFLTARQDPTSHDGARILAYICFKKISLPLPVFRE